MSSLFHEPNPETFQESMWMRATIVLVHPLYFFSEFPKGRSVSLFISGEESKLIYPSLSVCLMSVYSVCLLSLSLSHISSHLCALSISCHSYNRPSLLPRRKAAGARAPNPLKRPHSSRGLLEMDPSGCGDVALGIAVFVRADERRMDFK